MKPHMTQGRRTSTLIIAGILLAMLGYFLWAEHRADTVAALPYVLLLAVVLLCPLMHLFMHRDHGGGHDHEHTHHTSGKDDNRA